ncbi:daptide biosynthesis RiPP recognition protein [Frankia sp. R82]|uniref:daptide biosynthesis RiPP recognition protein n=1 Tax=Frankia sp. R82 TaxID=2950553 RepID=UPI002043EBA4|nr:daptide biosynthesis RiPP recognition protein [Frankia sp. R82]MCM3883386.1 hypothetical protein [Frankia sp. R82]
MREALVSRAGRHLRSWVTGSPLTRRAEGTGTGTGTGSIVLEDAGHLATLLGSGVVGPRSIVLVPGEHNGEAHLDTGGTVVGYEGSLSEPGGDAAVGGAIFLQIQDYGTSPYMSLLGTTLIRVAGQSDFEAFLADADQARAEGTFAAFAASPAVQLADLAGLGGAEPGDGPDTRLHVGHDGRISVSPQGLRLGSVGDPPAALRAEWERLAAGDPQGGPVPLGAVMPEEVRAPAVGERPWLGRYLAALELLRGLQTSGVTQPRVSGFGRRLVPALGEVEAPWDANDPGAPFLAWTSEAVYVQTPGRDRTFRLGRRAAEVAEMLLVHGSADAVLERVGRDVRSAPVDRALLDRVLTFFGDRGAPLLPATSSAKVAV